MVPCQPGSLLRILFFNRSYYPDVGATGQLLTELTEDLAKNYGCQISVVAGPVLVGPARGRPRGWSPLQREYHSGVEILRAWGTTLGPRRFAGRVTNYITYFLSSCLVALYVRSPDVVVSLTDPPIIGLTAFLTARWNRAPFVFVCQDVFPEVARLLQGFQSRTVHWLLDRISRFLIRNADRVVAIGETMQERLVQERGAEREKVKVIHNWADCSTISPGEKRNPFSLANELEDKFVVMHSGNLGLSQGLEIIVRTAAYLTEFPRIEIVFVGDGVTKAILEKQVWEQGLRNVRFLPYQDKEALRDSFASADIFIISLKRGLAGYIVPSKLYGILAAGRPYVACVEEACEVTTITRKYDCGLLAESDNPQDLADKILALYRDPSRTKLLGENARKAALRFDRPLGVKAYLDLFCEVTGFHAHV